MTLTFVQRWPSVFNSNFLVEEWVGHVLVGGVRDSGFLVAEDDVGVDSLLPQGDGAVMTASYAVYGGGHGYLDQQFIMFGPTYTWGGVAFPTWPNPLPPTICLP
jgi:hypothetical protein